MPDYNDQPFKDKHEVRLFPISKKGETEQRATASLLSMIMAVSEFGRAFIKDAGGPSGYIQCFTEIPFPSNKKMDNKTPRPDGAIRVVKANGEEKWKALLEVKTGDNSIDQKQFDVYQDIARSEGYKALLTISHQAVPLDRLPPVKVNKKIKTVKFIHYSWDRLLSMARIFAEKEGIHDEDQEYMLKEWIRYISDEKAGIIEPPKLSQHWGAVLSAIKDKSHVNKVQMKDVVEHWAEFLRKVALNLSSELGVRVEPKLSNEERKDYNKRISNLLSHVIDKSELVGDLKIKRTAGDLSLRVDLKTKQVNFGVMLDAPNEGTQWSRLSYISKQLKKAKKIPKDTKVFVEWERKRDPTCRYAEKVRTSWKCLLDDENGEKISKVTMPKRFRVKWNTALRKKKSEVLKGIAEDLRTFYREIVEYLEAYKPKPAKLSKEKTPSEEKQSKPNAIAKQK